MNSDETKDMATIGKRASEEERIESNHLPTFWESIRYKDKNRKKRHN